MIEDAEPDGPIADPSPRWQRGARRWSEKSQRVAVWKRAIERIVARCRRTESRVTMRAIEECAGIDDDEGYRAAHGRWRPSRSTLKIIAELGAGDVISETTALDDIGMPDGTYPLGRL